HGRIAGVNALGEVGKLRGQVDRIECAAIAEDRRLLGIPLLTVVGSAENPLYGGPYPGEIGAVRAPIEPVLPTTMEAELGNRPAHGPHAGEQQTGDPAKAGCAGAVRATELGREGVGHHLIGLAGHVDHDPADTAFLLHPAEQLGLADGEAAWIALRPLPGDLLLDGELLHRVDGADAHAEVLTHVILGHFDLRRAALLTHR